MKVIGYLCFVPLLIVSVYMAVSGITALVGHHIPALLIIWLVSVALTILGAIILTSNQ